MPRKTSKPKTHKVLPPFRGTPTTKVRINKHDDMRISVHASGLTPFRSKLSLHTAKIASLALGVFGISEWIIADEFDPLDLAKIIGIAFATYPLCQICLYQLLKSRVTIMFTKDQISVSKFFGWRTFDRAYPHSFVLLPHDKTDEEKNHHAFLDRKRPPKFWSRRRKLVYGASHHITLSSVGERHDIIALIGKKEATTIHARLQACDTIMDGADFGESGLSLTPADDWNIEAGGL